MMTIFEALADPTRRQILDLLRERPRLVGELVDHIGISQPGVSKQLKLLRDVGLVRVLNIAQRRWYELDPEPLAEIESWLAGYRGLLETQYSRLDSLLDRMKKQENTNEQA